MSNLLEIAEERRVELFLLVGDNFEFNGNLKPKILAPQQLVILRRLRELQRVDELLTEMGWLPGAIVRVAKFSLSRNESSARANLALTSSEFAGNRTEFNERRSFLMVQFPVDADILQGKVKRV